MMGVSRRVESLPSAPAPVAFFDAGSGPAVVLLHGQPGAAATWDRVAAPLRARARVIVPDRPGYGATGGRAVGIRENAEVVCQLLDRLGLERAVVAGHSWGGGIAVELAETAPSRVAGTVLACSIGTRSSVDRLDRLLAGPVVGPALVYAAFRTLARLLPLRPARRFVPGLGNLSDDALQDLVDTLHERRDWRSFLIEQRALIAEIQRLDERLTSITAPTRVLIGADDVLVAPAVGRELAERIPMATCEVVAGSGHVLPVEKPQAIVDAVRDLIDAG
jgi:pimeloyl-ACP methyl ester carboxylesterase